MNDHALKAQDNRLQIPQLARRARLRRLLVLLVLLAAAGAAVAYYTRPKPAAELYRVDRVARRTLIQLVETTGSVDVRSRVEVPAPTAGRLTSIAVQIRQKVEKGQLLATLDERAAQLAVRSAKVGVQAAAGRVGQAQAGFVSAQQVEERVRRLHDKGLASQQELGDAQSELARARAALDALRAERKLASEQVASAELGQSMSAIVAPAAGVVLRAPDRVGAAVRPEAGPLFVISDPLDTMRIEAFVGETEIALVQPGRKAEVLVQAIPGRSFSASVERIGLEPKREGGVVQYPVSLLVDNPDGALLPGMSARVRMEVARAEQVLSVHEAALRFSPEDAEPAKPRSRVFVRSGDNDLVEVAIEAGISDGVHTELKPAEGAQLGEGDYVAIGLLQPGQSSGKPSVSLGGPK